MKFFSFEYTIPTNLTEEAIVKRLKLMKDANRRHGFYFKYRQKDGRHWLVPEYVIWTRKIAINIEVQLVPGQGKQTMILIFGLPIYVKVFYALALMLFAIILINNWYYNQAFSFTGFPSWIFLFLPVIAIAILWAQFSGQVKDYIKAFKEGWAFAEREIV